MSTKGDIIDEICGEDKAADAFCAAAVFVVGVAAFIYWLIA